MLNDGFLPEESGEPTPVDLDDDLVDGCKRSALVPGNNFVTYCLLVVFFTKVLVCVSEPVLTNG